MEDDPAITGMLAQELDEPEQQAQKDNKRILKIESKKR
jgi:hypothetical protein